MEDTYALWVQAMFSTLYVLWGLSWAFVALSYGRAAYVSWVAARGQWRQVPADILSPFWWALHVLWKRATGKDHDPYPDRYTPGHLLRFAVFLGALAPACWGFYFVVLDRSTWNAAALAVNFTGVAISVLAALCHLWLAYRERPMVWSVCVGLMLAWAVLAPPVLTWLWL